MPPLSFKLEGPFSEVKAHYVAFLEAALVSL